VGNQKLTDTIPEGNGPLDQDDKHARPRPKVPKTRQKKRSTVNYAEGDLRANITNDAHAGITPDESLRQSGYIGHATEYIDKKDVA
jgi:hypothetical protein